MAGIGAWIAAMENWRTAVLGKPHKCNLGHENPWSDAAPDSFLSSDPAGLLQRGERESIPVEMSTSFKKPLPLRGRVGHSVAPTAEVTLTS
jgi:hypothetical protein